MTKWTSPWVSRGTIALQKTKLLRQRPDAVQTPLARFLVSVAMNSTSASRPNRFDVDGDRTRLAQVFANLLNNAAKYTANGGRIQLAVEREGNEVVVAVVDNGVGIQPDLLTRIFDMFMQIERSLQRSEGDLASD